MPPRLSLQPILRHSRLLVAPQQTAQFTKGAKRDAVYDIRPSSAANRLLNVDQPRGGSSITSGVMTNLLYGPGIREAAAKTKEKMQRNKLVTSQQLATSKNYMNQQARGWNAGDVYAPHDIAPKNLKKFARPTIYELDALDLLGINPIDEYSNFSMISEFMTTMGRIQHSSRTCLRPVNQRKMAKAIRRAIGLGLHPSVHRHPQILQSLMPRSQSLPPSHLRPSNHY